MIGNVEQNILVVKRRPAAARCIGMALIVSLGVCTVVTASDKSLGPLPLCSGAMNAEALTNGDEILGLYAVGDGTYLTYTVDAAEAGACLMATPANLHFRFEDASANAVIEDGTPPVLYDFSSAPFSLVAKVVEPVLCESYYADSDKHALKLTDTNNVQHEIRGFDSFEYQVNIGRLIPRPWVGGAYDSYARCHVFPYGAMTANPPTQPTPADTSHIILKAGFESVSDLEVLFFANDGSNTPLQLNKIEAYPGVDFSYRVRIRNVGEIQAENVRIREFLPASGGSVTPGVEAIGCSVAGISCSGTVVWDVSTIPAGGHVEFTLTRKISGAPAGAKALVAMAAFSDPEKSSDANIQNNGRALVVELVNNQAPVINCDGLSDPLQLQESHTPQPIVYNCTVSDADGDLVTGLSASSSNANLLQASAALTSPGHWDLTLSQQPGKFGQATVTLTASAPPGPNGAMTFVVQVAEVNDPPTFDLTVNEVRISSGGNQAPQDNDGVPLEFPDYPGLEPELDASCFNTGGSLCKVTIRGFITNVSPGLGETHQSVMPATTTCTSSGGGPSQMFPTNLKPIGVVSTSGSTVYDLQFEYLKYPSGPPSGLSVTCTLKFGDNGTPPMQSQGLPSEKITFSYF